jgi:hypothetical protein
VAKPWWNTEICLVLKLARDWKSKAKQELTDTNTILAEMSTKLKETSKTESNKKRKNGYKKYSKKHTLTTFGLSGNGPKVHETTQYLPYPEDQTDRKQSTQKKKLTP